MRFHLKCSCGAEATWETTENEPDAAVEASAQVDRWLAEHECREADLSPDEKRRRLFARLDEALARGYAPQRGPEMASPLPPDPAKECKP